MKTIVSFLISLLIVSCAKGKEKEFTGSTPANALVKSFLGIPLTDSVDFIRWKLSIGDGQYGLQCNYGIGKQNTNGFISGGKWVEVTGRYTREKNYLRLSNGNKYLRFAELNGDLLHIMDEENHLAAGTGGWSYTLNNLHPTVTDQFFIPAGSIALKDSMSFQGRTPCGVNGVVAPGSECYKLKWYIVLYADPLKNQPGRYRIPGSPWYKEGGRTGTWNILTGKDGRIIYQLKDDKENSLFYLLRLDENVLLFTNADGKLLVGDGDFSYTISRKF